MTAKDTDPCPEITVIAPIFNARPFLAECLESVLVQEGPTFEVILVDDGSTDGSGEICDEYARRDKRVRVVHQANAGPGAARNRGLDLARGEFVTFVDADDFLETDALAALATVAAETGTDFVRGEIRMIQDADGPPTYLGGVDSFLPPISGFAYIDEKDGRPQAYVRSNSVACLIRMQPLRDRNIRFNTDLLIGEDLLFMLTLAESIKTYHRIDRVVYNYRRQTLNSLTSTYSPTRGRRARESMECLDFLARFLERNNPPDTVAAAMGNVYVSFAIRGLVVFAADSLTGMPDAFARFSQAFSSPMLRRMLPYYRPGSGAGKSRLLPFLIRLKMLRAAFFLCRRKASRRYARELAAMEEAAEKGKGST